MEMDDPILFPRVIWKANIIPAASFSLLETAFVPFIIQRVVNYPFPNPIKKEFRIIMKSFSKRGKARIPIIKDEITNRNLLNVSRASTPFFNSTLSINVEYLPIKSANVNALINATYCHESLLIRLKWAWSRSPG